MKTQKNLQVLLVALSAIFSLSACDMRVNVDKLDEVQVQSSENPLFLSLANINKMGPVEINEGSALVVRVSQNMIRNKETLFTAQVSGEATALATTFPLGTLFTGTIPAGALTGVIFIPSIHSSTPGTNQTFEVALKSSDTTPEWLSSFTLTVKDIESALPTLSISPSTTAEGGVLSFTISLSAASTNRVSLNYTTVDSTAKAGAEYTSASGSLIFNPGETSKVVTVNTIDQTQMVCSGTKQMLLTISNLDGAQNSQPTAQGSIAETDNPTIDSFKQTLHSNQAPAIINSTDNIAYELGMGFKVSTAGKIVALRRLQALSESGTHIGHLWKMDGTLLAEVFYPAVSGFRWTEAILNPPINVNAGDEFFVSTNINQFFVLNATGLTTPISKGDLVSVGGGKYINAPGAFPTTASGTGITDYFTDVTFIPDKALNCLPDKAQSIFDSIQIPQAAFSDGGTGMELGIRVVPQVNGYITAIKYYQAAGEDITRHFGKIWSATGSLLTTVTFTDSPGEGWKTATLTTPFAVTARNEYVISVNSKTMYGASHNIFSNPIQPRDLLAPIGAGVYSDGESIFPSKSYINTSYLRDVIFYNEADYQALTAGQ